SHDEPRAMRCTRRMLSLAVLGAVLLGVGDIGMAGGRDPRPRRDEPASAPALDTQGRVTPAHGAVDTVAVRQLAAAPDSTSSVASWQPALRVVDE
ncbi:hypothetical protein, partial [Nitrospira sp. BLG_2]|uniref:hypothetical protein n=1 Tax=Nitrospira sp. BLG_2 TaxID=3397507 RepID=UPI003B9C5C34